MIFKKLCCCLSVLLLFGLYSCGKNVSVKQGQYTAESRENIVAPSLTLDLEHNRFTFTYDVLSSYLNTGTIYIKGHTLTAVTDDGQYTYCFDIHNDTTLLFAEKGSSPINTMQGNCSVTDRTEFVWIGNNSES